jgi:hypothetical protein
MELGVHCHSLADWRRLGCNMVGFDLIIKRTLQFLPNVPPSPAANAVRIGPIRFLTPVGVSKPCRERYTLCRD